MTRNSYSMPPPLNLPSFPSFSPLPSVLSTPFMKAPEFATTVKGSIVFPPNLNNPLAPVELLSKKSQETLHRACFEIKLQAYSLKLLFKKESGKGFFLQN